MASVIVVHGFRRIRTVEEEMPLVPERSTASASPRRHQAPGEAQRPRAASTMRGESAGRCTRARSAPTSWSRARAGDAEAFTRIVDAHHADLVRVAYAVCGDADLAREAAQTAWIKVWQRLGSLREADKLRPWLVSIASNEARQAVRSRRRRRVREVPALDPEFATSRPVATRADRGAVRT